MRRITFPVTAALLFVSGQEVPAKSATCPSDMVPTGRGTCIDRFEWPNKRGVKPLVGASGVAEEEDLKEGRVMDAERLCASVGKRVCYRREWISACQGPEKALYPFGNELPKYNPDQQDGLCNYDKWFRPVNERKVARRDQDEMDRLDQSDPSGSRQSCRSESGAFDMMGNAEEWVRCPGTKHGWCLMGRFWSSPEPCTYAVSSHAPKWHYYESGFRCCKDVPKE
jgi:hypothetical protein